jgi:hypothetical protein
VLCLVCWNRLRPAAQVKCKVCNKDAVKMDGHLVCRTCSSANMPRRSLVIRFKRWRKDYWLCGTTCQQERKKTALEALERIGCPPEALVKKQLTISPSKLLGTTTALRRAIRKAELPGVKLAGEQRICTRREDVAITHGAATEVMRKG